MKLIAHGQIYDHQPMGSECDLDSMVDNLTAAAVSRTITSLFVDAFAAAAGLLPIRPVTTPGTPNEMRSE